MVIRLIVFLSSANLICRTTDISKCFIESLGFRDNDSRLYLTRYHTSQNYLAICRNTAGWSETAFCMVTSRRAHDVYTTSAQRRCNVMTLHRRWGDVVLTSCACWDLGLHNLIRPVCPNTLCKHATFKLKQLLLQCFTWKKKKKYCMCCKISFTV